MGKREWGSHLVEVEVSDEDAVEVSGVQREGVGVDADQIGRGCLRVSGRVCRYLDVVQQLRGQQRDEGERVVHGAEKRQQRGGAERELVFLGVSGGGWNDVATVEKDLSVAQQCRHDGLDVRERETAQQALHAERVAEGQTVGWRKRELNVAGEERNLRDRAHGTSTCRWQPGTV